MSMISPEAFIEYECKGKSYNDLLGIRDNLLESIIGFENGKVSSETRIMSPSAEIIYQMNLNYLEELCKLISDTYSREIVWKEDV